MLRLGVELVEGTHLCCAGQRDGSGCPCFKGSESPCSGGGHGCVACTGLLLAVLAVARSFCRLEGLGWWCYRAARPCWAVLLSSGSVLPPLVLVLLLARCLGTTRRGPCHELVEASIPHRSHLLGLVNLLLLPLVW